MSYRLQMAQVRKSCSAGGSRINNRKSTRRSARSAPSVMFSRLLAWTSEPDVPVLLAGLGFVSIRKNSRLCRNSAKGGRCCLRRRASSRPPRDSTVIPSRCRARCRFSRLLRSYGCGQMPMRPMKLERHAIRSS